MLRAKIVNPEAIPAASERFTTLLIEMIKSGEIPIEVIKNTAQKENKEY